MCGLREGVRSEDRVSLTHLKDGKETHRSKINSVECEQ